MVQERGYTRQQGPARVQGAVLRNADDYGAAIGRAMEGAGDQLHQNKIRARGIERQAIRNQEWTDASAKIAEREAEITAGVAEARANAAPGAAGHVDAVREAAAKGWDEILDGVTEDAVRQRIRQRRDQYLGALTERETLFQVGRQSEKVATDAQKAMGTMANIVATGTDLDYADQSRQLDEFVTGLEGLPADAVEKLRREGHQGLTLGYLDRMNTEDPVTALALLDGGAFNDILDPPQLQRAREAARIEIRRGEAAAERQADAAKAALKERVQTYREMDSQGMDIGDVSEDIAMLRELGDESAALDLEGRMANNEYARVYSDATPLQRERRANELRGLAKPTPAQQRELKWLDDHQAALDGQFKKDPVGFAAENAAADNKPPALEFGNSGSWAARVKWSSAASEAYGREMPLLTTAEVGALREVAESEGGEGQVLRELDLIPDGFARARTAEQILPDDKVFHRLAMLQPQYRATVRAGAAALKANSAMLKAGDEKPEADEMRASWNRRLAFALREFDPGDIASVQTVAEQYMAGILSKTGQTAVGITENSYRLALRYAMGGEIREGRRLGGISTWREMPVAVPEGMDAEQLGGALIRDRRRRDANPPVNPDGTVLDLHKAYPVYMGGGQYYWEVRAGARVRAKDGTLYVSQVDLPE